MSEYRRFVAYIYRYLEGKKEKNTGYVKVDARNGICRMQMQIQSQEVGNQKMQVFGFARRGAWLLGVPLGEAAGKNGSFEWSIHTSAQKLRESEFALSDLSGMWVEGEAGERFLTVWDDEPVDVRRFTLELPKEEKAKKEGTKEEEIKEERKKDAAGAADAPETMTPGTIPGLAQVQAEEEQAKGLAVRWQQFLYHYPGICPFADGAFAQCIRIAPKDISFLGENEWDFGRNPFVQQAYARYGHLLAGRCTDERFILGVPGIYYDEQDRHLARMYGFPEFKLADAADETMALPEEEERYGYWYHYIQEAFS